jgi:hemerythrin
MRRDPVRVMRVLEQWLVEHVQKEDRAMAQWLFAPWDPAGPGARAGHKQP